MWRRYKCCKLATTHIIKVSHSQQMYTYFTNRHCPYSDSFNFNSFCPLPISICVYTVFMCFLYVHVQEFTYVCIVCGRLRLIPDFIDITLVLYSLRQGLSIRPREQQYDGFHQSAFSWESLISACKAQLEECTIPTWNVSSVDLKSSPRFVWQEL